MHVARALEGSFPQPRVELDYKNALELFVATVLAAQCTDVKVNEVTRDLFSKYYSAEDYVVVALEDLDEDIRPTEFYRQKAKNISATMETLIERHGGKCPTAWMI